MNNGIRNLPLGFAVFAGLSIMSSSSFAQLNSNSLEKRLVALEKLTQDQQTRIQALETKLKYVTVNGTDMMITGANLHLRNGTGAMSVTNGLGNLTIGYNIDSGYSDRTGSHNLLMGRYLNYTSYGSIITGEENSALGQYSSILSSYRGRTTEESNYSSLFSTSESWATKGFGSVIAARTSQANSYFSGILGGETNVVDAGYSAIAGGKLNKIWLLASHGTIAGGTNNQIWNGQFNNIVGGYGNEIYGNLSSISGGANGLIEAAVTGGSITGGDNNTIHNNYSTIGGGHDLTTTINMQFKGGSLSG
jgi:hypothetical protein